jgi:hypothetical protein
MPKTKIVLTLAVASILITLTLLGNVTTQAANPTWNVQTVSRIGFSSGCSIALDKTGIPHIACVDEFYGLRYASWNGSNWSIQDIDKNVGAADNFKLVSFALDSLGNPHMVYIGDSNHPGLKYATWSGKDWSIQTIDSSQGGFSQFELVMDANDNLYVAYCFFQDTIEPYSTIKYAFLEGSGWKTQTLDSGSYPSLAFDSKGNPQIVYLNTYLMYANWTGSHWNKQTIDEIYGGAYSLALDSKDNPHITYNVNYTLHYVFWDGSRWQVQLVASDINDYGCPLVLDSSDKPHICYSVSDGANGTLTYAIFDGSSWNRQPLSLDSGLLSLVLDSKGNPQICYTFTTYYGSGDYGGELKFASTGNLPTATLPPTNTQTINPKSNSTINYNVLIFGAVVAVVVVLAVAVVLFRFKRAKAQTI